MPVLRAGEALMRSVVDVTDDEARQAKLTPQYIPDSLRTVLPIWKHNMYYIDINQNVLHVRDLYG